MAAAPAPVIVDGLCVVTNAARFGGPSAETGRSYGVLPCCRPDTNFSEEPPDTAFNPFNSTNDPAYVLQLNTNLITTNWTAATPSPILLGANFVVTNAAAGAAMFYRLIK